MLHKWTRWSADMDRTVAQSNDDLFFKTPDAKDFLDSRRKMGFEEHSIIADPLFCQSASHGDCRLQPGSPAVELGFQPIDFDRIGPRAR